METHPILYRLGWLAGLIGIATLPAFSEGSTAAGPKNAPSTETRAATYAWPHWRGSGFDGTATADGAFSKPFDLAIHWRMSLGSGYSGVVAAGLVKVHQPEVEVVGLMTTFNQAVDRVAMHAVRRSLVEAQAAATGLPLWAVDLPWPCSNDDEQRMATVIRRARDEAMTHIAFGDLFLEDIRDYRVRQLRGTGVEPLFPIWGTPSDTPQLAREMVASGVRAVLSCVDPKQLDEEFIGRQYDEQLLRDLADGVDPCGERGEFHTFCYAAPVFDREIAVRTGETVEPGPSPTLVSPGSPPGSSSER